VIQELRLDTRGSKKVLTVRAADRIIWATFNGSFYREVCEATMQLLGRTGKKCSASLRFPVLWNLSVPCLKKFSLKKKGDERPTQESMFLLKRKGVAISHSFSERLDWLWKSLPRALAR